MKLILILSILMSGCTSIPHFDKWHETRNNFRYIEDIEGEILAYDRIDREFLGDCDDFAATLKKQIGGNMFAVKYQGYWHAVLVKDGFVYDNAMKTPVAVEAYEGEFVGEMAL